MSDLAVGRYLRIGEVGDQAGLDPADHARFAPRKTLDLQCFSGNEGQGIEHLPAHLVGETRPHTPTINEGAFLIGSEEKAARTSPGPYSDGRQPRTMNSWRLMHLTLIQFGERSPK